ncbi:MAG: M20/M25/M40 family metallo-hydrolase [Bacteroidales bacterium]|nr:M20/M25/M40 family metallo-hydrolase [Bacteroidales bacterium]
MKLIFQLLLVGLIGLSSCSPKLMPEITAGELRDHVGYLASDALKGRYPGTPEDSLLNIYISREFRSYGIKPFDGNYIQRFTFLSGISPSPENQMQFEENVFVQEKDFYPFSFSGSGEITSEIVIGGYGFDFQTVDYERNDYSSIDPKGKWILIFRGEPENHPALIERSRDRDKAMLAAERGAVGVLLVSGEEFTANDELPLNLSHEPEISIPVLAITRKAAGKLIEKTGISLHDLEIKSKTANPEIYIPDLLLQARIEIEKIHASTANVMGFLEGKNSSLNEWIVIGAHHDHLGMGGPGSSSRAPDTLAVHTGADDNASGVAALLELAEYFSAKQNRPQRNLLFVTFGAEEKGLLGSRYFTSNPPLDLSSISAMVNLDMMGRMKADSSLQIGGVGTSVSGKDIIELVNKDFNLNLSLSDAGYGPSDHASFYTRDIPVFFLSTGAHSDYHTPMDNADLINYHGLDLGAKFTAKLIQNIDMEEGKLAFREAGPRTNTSRSFRNKITLGIMPDVSGEGRDGMTVLAVTPGKPADLGGMHKGDIITSIEGKNISNVYDYMYRLNELKPGERIVVTVKRNSISLDLLIQL